MSRRRRGGGMNIKTSKGMGINTKQKGPDVYDQMKEYTKWDIKRGPKRRPQPKPTKEAKNAEPVKVPKQTTTVSIGSLVRSYNIFKDRFEDV